MIKKLIGGCTFVVIILAIVGFAGYNGISMINSEFGSILITASTPLIGIKSLVVSALERIGKGGRRNRI